MRDLYQRSLIRGGDWKPRVKEASVPELESYAKRMSKTVFTDYLLGSINAPSPIVIE